MPVNKDALARYRVIDKLLSDPNNTYTTEEIRAIVNRECSEKVSLRMIQKDIKSLEEDFGKDMVRNAGGRAKVKYLDQSEPLFYQELTSDEEAVLSRQWASLRALTISHGWTFSRRDWTSRQKQTITH